MEYINQRIMTIRFKHKGTFYKVISVYAPTFSRPEPEKDEFYDTLRTNISKTASTDTLIILGDFNARVGVRDEAWQT